eukprot:TRINITY_DN2809_c0_g1_i10.p2 TRINITY_DN2809_c0_g1~~TRINITY_DN2809_c0_g1_i10.p2  ORF type:complete len:176 (+),score=18.47 TRINITY_DN2809_c0_g1_i10:97-624(+)
MIAALAICLRLFFDLQFYFKGFSPIVLVVMKSCVFFLALVTLSGHACGMGEEGLEIKIDLARCRLNNCTVVDLLEDMPLEKKFTGFYSGTTTSVSSCFGCIRGFWNRKLQSPGGCENAQEDVKQLLPCCEELVVEEDIESVCSLASQFDLDCEYFMEFNDVKEQYVKSGSVFQIC